ncbi:MAG: TonB-dependent receptor [Saprospiraceae bacterium]
MKKILLPFRLLLVLLLAVFVNGQLQAQNRVSGQVLDSDGSAIIGASVKATTGEGALTDENGNFAFSVGNYPATLIIRYIGYAEQRITVNDGNPVSVTLSQNLQLDDVVIVGSRFAPRTVITSPVPIDNIRRNDLEATSQVSFDKQLMYTVPSFNSTNQTISDATAHFDPFDLRGLGPSRTLVLINGKRKNASSLVYINDTPGKGEVGVDMKSIPAAAIERVEILRDGASAQYGSDAIAGVVNVILKEDYEYTTANVFAGMTTEGDGETMGYNVNTGFKLGNRGYMNITHSFMDQKHTNRAGSPGKDDLFGVDDAWTTANPQLGMTVGQPNLTSGDVFFNGNVELGGQAEAYGFGGFTYRKGSSFALYRTPYWRPTDFGLLTPPGQSYEGFQPLFDTDIFDNTLVLGVRGEKNNWQYDISYDQGSNSVDYTVPNSINTSMGSKSPTTFDVGGYTFKHDVMNFDLFRKWNQVSLSLGSEIRVENFQARAGDEASYLDGLSAENASNYPDGYGPAGAQSFPGLQPQNEVDAVRYNVGAYAELNYDLTEDFLIGGAVRTERYSDFGNTTNWKANARYKFLDDKVVVRGSYSTGFRAPSLHQIYLSNIQTLISGGSVSEQGTFNNESSVLRQLGVNRLKQEEAVNFTAGLALRPVTGLYLSIDYYNIEVNNRIVYSSSISSSDTSSVVYDILAANNITSLKFFINAVDTRTSGIDLVANYQWAAGNGKAGINLAANFNQNEINGAVSTPEVLATAGIDIFDRKEQSRILTARPNDKIILGLSYETEKFRINLNNTRFGEVTWQHVDNGLNASLGLNDEDFDQTFSAKIVTDLNLSYQITRNVRFGIAANNLLNVYPDVIDTKGDVVTDLGGRFLYPWEVNQFGFNGTTLMANLNFRF